MTKCIGGKFDGEQARDDNRLVLMQKLEPRYAPMPPPSAAFEILAEVSESNVVAQYYTRREVRCNDSTIQFYAPEDWSDERVLRHVLT